MPVSRSFRSRLASAMSNTKRESTPVAPKRHLEGTLMTTEQKPLNSGFGAKTTGREVLAGRDLTGKTAVVTGGYSGVGLETTRALAEAGATVVVPARTQEKARTALAGIPRVEVETLELIDPASIDAFAGRFLDSRRPLDILINNAGIMAPPLRRDARGYESQFATTFRALPVDGAALASLEARRKGTGCRGLFHRDQLRGRRF